jgi:hypothetical protein
MTIPRFDIFRIEKNGGLFWIGTADDVAEAQKLVTKQPSAGSRDFVLFDLKTGDKKAMNSGDLQPQNHEAVGCATPRTSVQD